MATISAFRVTQHNQIFHFSLEIEFTALRFINYTIPMLCSTYAVATLAAESIGHDSAILPDDLPVKLWESRAGWEAIY